MADVLTHIDTLDVELESPQQQDIEVGATAEQLLPLIDVNQKLAAANRQLVEQVLPTLRGGLQTKEVAPADIEQVITPDDGYLGLSRVKIVPSEDLLSVSTLLSNNLLLSVDRLIDSNITQWEWNKNLLSYFTNLKELKLNCNILTFSGALSLPHSIEKIELPFLRKIKSATSAIADVFSNLQIRELYLPELIEFSSINYEAYLLFSNLPECVVVNMPKLETISINRGGGSITFFTHCPELREVHFPKLRNKLDYGTYGLGLLCPKLELIEIGKNHYNSVALPNWNPVEVLSSDSKIKQFFVNFVEYILHRLQNRTGASKLTLTLSATVYDAIFSDESGFVYNGQPIGEYVTSYIAAINWSVAKAS